MVTYGAYKDKGDPTAKSCFDHRPWNEKRRQNQPDNWVTVAGQSTRHRQGARYGQCRNAD